MISSFFVSSSSFFSCMLQCHFGSSEHVSLSLCMFSYGSKMIAVERREEREKTLRIQPTHYLQLIAVFVLVLITINYLIISIWIISYFFWNISISPHDRLRETWVSNFPFSCNRYRFSASFKRIADPIIGIWKLIIVNVLLSILVYLFVQWLSHVWLNEKNLKKDSWKPYKKGVLRRS